MNSNKVENIYNYLQLSDSVATSGQPTEEQFAAIKDAGYETVVNLALSTSANAIDNEREIVETQGMKYVHIPVLWEEPTLEDVDRFFQVMQANSDRKVYVHCAANMRVSAFMYLYRHIHEQLEDDLAKADLYKIWIPNQTWQKFIDETTHYYQHVN